VTAGFIRHGAARVRVFCVIGFIRMSLQSRRRAMAGCSVAMIALTLAACSNPARQETAKKGFSPSEYGVAASKRVVEPGTPVPRGGGVYRVGKAYKVRGKSYQPKFDPSHDEAGVASWYGDDFHGRRTANGEVYDMHAFSAAHRTLPLPSYVRVTNTTNGRSVVVRVNDRGPFHSDRIIDLSKRSAQLLDFHGRGVARVRVTYVGAAPLDGNDDWLVTTVKANGVPVPPQEVARLAPIPDWAVHPVGQKSPIQLALADTLAPLPQPRPREEPVQLASAGAFVPTSAPRPAPLAATPQPPVPALAAPVNAPVILASTAPAVLSGDHERKGGQRLIFGVNAGSFRDPAEAFRIRDGLSPLGQAVVDPVNVSGITFYQVRLAPLFGQPAAEKAVESARKLGAVSARILPL